MLAPGPSLDFCSRFVPRTVLFCPFYGVPPYREPLAARAALHELVKQEGWAKAAQEVARDPAQFGELRGKEGWLASGKAKQERAQAERTAGTLPDSLRRIGAAEDAARGGYMRDVKEQQARDATEIPGLSRGAKAALNEVQVAITATQQGQSGERYDAQLRRREETIAGAWAAGRTTPEVTAELDRFMAAAGRRLGEEGIREASRAAHSGRSMTVPGTGREHQAGLDELARSYTLGRQATEHSAAWGQRMAREMERAEERQRLGLPPEQPREGQRRGLGFGR